MDLILYPRKLSGSLNAIPSKSQAHRLLICCAFADKQTTLICPETNDDIEATADCLAQLGAKISRIKNGYVIDPITVFPSSAVLNCRESGSTLRFMLPIAAALGTETTFLMSGRLPLRPLSPLWEVLQDHGVNLSRPSNNSIHLTGKLQNGTYSIDGGVSSQFITGLIYALSLLNDKSNLQITGTIESKPYIDLTVNSLNLFGININYSELGNAFPFHSPETVIVEGDWSNAAFFIGANALCNNIQVTGLSLDSKQGDRAVLTLTDDLKQDTVISGADIPDLIPILAVVAAANHGATFENIGRLRLKESDRVQTTCEMLNALGAKTQVTNNTMQVFPAPFIGCVINAHNDHRIAMAGAIASTISHDPVIILGADCVKKSYPNFWAEFSRLGGYYEQYIR